MPVVETPALLITDDDRALRETLAGVFVQRGYRTLVAGDGEEALTIVGRERVQLLLLDMYMPKLTGLETIRRVKQVHHRLPCILMSGKMDERLVEEARLAMAFSVLAKPVRVAEVTNVVERALRAARGGTLS